jgi:aquaporin Z
VDAEVLRRSVAEFVGVFIFVFVSAGVVVNGASLLSVALASGLAFAVMITALGHISGGHFNPAITLGVLATGGITLGLAAVYWTSQLAGSVLAALLVRAAFDDEAVDAAHLGAPSLAEGVNVGEGFLLELIMTFFLVFVFFATLVDRRGAFRIVAGFAVGLTITVAILVAGPLTGAAMNPALAFGTQLVAGFWADGWIYYLAPLTGGVIAAVLYDRVFLRPREAAGA